MEILGINLLQETSAFAVSFLALFVSTVSGIIHRKMVDRKKLDRVREEIEKHQKAYLEAQKSKDEKKLKKLEAEQARILGLVKQNMIDSMKPTLVVMLIVIPMFWYLNTTYSDSGPLVQLPVSLPLLTYCIDPVRDGCANQTQYVADTGVITVEGDGFMGWFGLYIILALTSGITIEFINWKVLKKK
jgi:uncharacterized membrane protein (DUF106 family)